MSADGEIQDVVKKASAGVCSDAGDAKGLAENIIKLVNLPNDEYRKMAQNAIKYYNKNFDKDSLLNRMDKWFSDKLR